MKFILNGDKLNIEDIDVINSGSLNYYEADIEYDDSWNDLAIKAILMKRDETVGQEVAVVNNKIFIDQKNSGIYTIGFVGFKLENEKKIYQISSNLKVLYFDLGAGEMKAENQEVPTATEWEIYVSQLQDFIREGQKIVYEANNLDIELQDNVLTITKKDGTTYSENVKGEQGIQGKPGSIKIIPIKEFPTENIVEDAIYIIPNPKPTSEKDKYLEYLYINNDWEPFSGSINIDLEDFVKKDQYASSSIAGLVTIQNRFGLQMGATGAKYLLIKCATNDEIDEKTNLYNPIVPSNLDYAVASVKASETQSGTAKMWISENEDGEIGLNISTEV